VGVRERVEGGGRNGVAGQRLLQHGRYADLSRLVVTLELDGHRIADLDSGLLAQPLVEADQAHAGVDGDRRPDSTPLTRPRTGARA
jgi:hypothetical protein